MTLDTVAGNYYAKHGFSLEMNNGIKSKYTVFTFLNAFIATFMIGKIMINYPPVKLDI